LYEAPFNLSRAITYLPIPFGPGTRLFVAVTVLLFGSPWSTNHHTTKTQKQPHDSITEDSQIDDRLDTIILPTTDNSNPHSHSTHQTLRFESRGFLHQGLFNTCPMSFGRQVRRQWSWAGVEQP
jgi:hypothetical protein